MCPVSEEEEKKADGKYLCTCHDLSSVYHSATEALNHFLSMYPSFRGELDKMLDHKSLQSVTPASFQTLKRKILVVRCMERESSLTEDVRQEVVTKIFSTDKEDSLSSLQKDSPQGLLSFVASSFTSLFRSDKPMSESRYLSEQKMDMTDAQFLSSLEEILGDEPLLQESITNVLEIVNAYFQKNIGNMLKKLIGRASVVQEQSCKVQINRAAQSRQEKREIRSREDLLPTLNKKIKENREYFD